MRDVVLDRLLGEVEFFGDLPVDLPLADSDQHLSLPGCERPQPLGVLPREDPVDRGHLVPDEVTGLVCLNDEVDHLLHRRGFLHESVSPGLSRLEDHCRVPHGAHHDGGGPRRQSTQPSDQLQAVETRQQDLRDDDIGTCLGNGLDRIFETGCRTDQLEPGVTAEDPRERSPHDLLIIDDEYAYRRLSHAITLWRALTADQGLRPC